MPARWFKVYERDGRVVLDIYPNEEGGTTLFIDPAEAIELVWALKKAIARAKGGGNDE